MVGSFPSRIEKEKLSQKHSKPSLKREVNHNIYGLTYLDILPKILKQYNNTKDSSIQMTPVEASKKKNESIVYFNFYGDIEQLSSKPKFKVVIKSG